MEYNSKEKLKENKERNQLERKTKPRKSAVRFLGKFVLHNVIATEPS